MKYRYQILHINPLLVETDTITCDDFYIKENSLVFINNKDQHNEDIIKVLPASSTILTLLEESSKKNS